jgi:type I restriction enzyme S subunit
MADPLIQYPDGWLVGTLEAEPRRGLIERVESGGTPSTTNDDFWDGGIPWLTPKEVTDRGDSLFVSTTERTISPAGVAASAAKLMPAGTVMLTKRAPVGAVVVNAVPMSTNQGFLNFVCGPKLRPLYLALWLRTNTRYLHQVANGSTYPELYKGDLFEFQIGVPTIAIQDAILDVLGSLQYLTLLGIPLQQSALDVSRMAKIQAQNERLSAIRDTLVYGMLSGKLDVNHVQSRFKMVRQCQTV